MLLNFVRQVETELTDVNLVTLLSYKMYFDYSGLEDNEVNKTRGTILPVVFRDELMQHAGMLIQELKNSLTLEIQEQRHVRNRLFARVIGAWLDTSSTHKIAHKILQNPQQYLTLLRYVMTAWFEDRFEKAMFEVIEQK